MKITIYGCGYVGLVSAACFAELGHDVLAIDIDPNKIAQLNQGEVHIHEPGLSELIKKNLAAKSLAFSHKLTEGVAHGLYQFIAVNTPMDVDGSADISRVLDVAKTIATHMTDYRLIINKSTVPIGTAAEVNTLVMAILAERDQLINFDVASNPEFLKEGDAINDFMHPDRIVLGCDSSNARDYLYTLYEEFAAPCLVMDPNSAELSKYAANAMLATKISFINEMANIAEKVGADIEAVRQSMSFDPRIGPHFIAPGCGYGGSCFPKDVKALIHTANSHEVTPHLIHATEIVNQEQKYKLFQKIQQHFHGKLQERCFAVWGLAFKPNTDDIREAPSRILLEALWQAGARVQAYDPAAMIAIRQCYGDRSDLVLCQDALHCLDQADGLIVVTEWPEFKTINPEIIKTKLANPVVFDGRNIFDPLTITQLGIKYYGIGR